MQKFISVEEAQDAILAAPTLVGAERIMLSESAGRRLAETILAPEDSPPFDNSAMDGFAVCSSNLAAGQAYQIVGESAAGRPYSGSLSAGQAIRIMTGAQVPAGEHTVVVREVAVVEDDQVTFSEIPAQRANIRHRGSAMATDELVLDIGDPIGPGEVGLLSGFQRSTLSVFRKPVVAIITTGDELVEIGEPRGPGQIVNSNAYMLRALLETDGCIAQVFPIIPDNLEATKKAFERAVRSSDIVLSVGGVSVGDYDFVREVLHDVAEGMEFWKIQMKPGKPLAFGKTAEGVPLIGLPGNPVSAFVCYHQFVRPLTRMLQGVCRQKANLKQAAALVSCDMKSTPKRRHYVTGELSFQPHPIFTPFHDLSSGNLGAVVGINALALIEVGVSSVKKGEKCLVDLL